VDSSNYDPAPAWSSGSQMVALNYQTNDVAMQVNRGMFRDNAQCGYLLKPKYMRSASTNIAACTHVQGLRLTVTVLSGHQLPKPGSAMKGEVIDPFVSVSIHGLPEDEAEFKTKTVNDNGFNPFWNEVEFCAL
jgi:hypothetical protein